MIAPETPANNRDRLRALWALEIRGTPAEERYERIIRIAGLTLETPIAYLSFIDENRQWLKANVGMPLCETDRKISFCGHTILEDRPLVIPDTIQDPRFHDNPMVRANRSSASTPAFRCVAPMDTRWARFVLPTASRATCPTRRSSYCRSSRRS